MQATKTLSELQLRIIRLETYIISITGQDLSPLGNFKGVEAEDGSWTTPALGGLPHLPGSSRKRQRHDENSESDTGAPSSSTSRLPQQQIQDHNPPPQNSHSASAPSQSQENLDGAADDGSTLLEEARYLQEMTRNHDASLPRDHGAKERLTYHPFTSRIRATARDIPPEEMLSTDEEGSEAHLDQSTLQAMHPNNLSNGANGLSALDLPLDSSTLDDNAPHSPPLSSHRGFVSESSNPAAGSIGMRRTGSASSAPAALGPTTAKISSSNASDFRVDKKGNLRYLGSASTSAVVAELADRQRWDVESPAILQSAQTAAAAARRKNNNISRQQNGTGAPNTTHNGQNGNGENISSSNLASVEELDDSTPEPGTSSSAAALQNQKREFARPPVRPKPWEIFSNLGVTVAGALPPVEEIALPPEDLARKLIDGFFEHIHPL